MNAEQEAALDALLPRGDRSGDLITDLVAGVRASMAIRVANSHHGGTLLAALHDELDSWRQVSRLTGIPTMTCRSWAAPPPGAPEGPEQ